MQTRPDGCIYNSETQLLAHADDLVITGTTPYALSEAYKECEEVGTKIGLKINEKKQTKYMSSKKNTADGFLISGHNFEKMQVPRHDYHRVK